MENKEEEWYVRERREIMDYFKSMTKKELIKYIYDNLFFLDDYCIDKWFIGIDWIVGMEE